MTILFDDQPTNRAGMNGVSPCNKVLDAKTSATLKGTGDTEANCYWEDASTLIVLLASTTLAGKDMGSIGILPDVLWPEVYQGNCSTTSNPRL